MSEPSPHQSGLRKRVARKLWAFARVQAYLSFVGAILLCVGSAAAYREGKKLTLNLGEQLTGRLRVLGGEVEQVVVNGAEFSFGALVVKGNAGDVLSVIEQDCKDHSGDLGEQFRAAAKLPRVAAEVPDFDPSALTTLRRDVDTPGGGRSGDVVCALRDNAPSEPGIFARLEAFAASGNLSDFGKVRYIRADAQPGSDSTRVLALWTDSPLNLERMFAQHGDVPGTDPKVLARPPGARRIFSGVVPRTGDGVYAYEASLPPQEVLRFYEESLPKQHFLPVPLALRDDRAPADSRAYVRDGRAAIVLATRKSVERPTDVAIVVLEARRFATATATAE